MSASPFERSHAFDAERLLIEDLDLDLVVGVTAAGPMFVQLAGSREAVQAVDVTCDGTLRIAGPAPRAITALVTIPAGRPVRLRRITGDVLIGDTAAPLSLELGDAVHVVAGRLGDADVAIDGDARVTIEHVSAERVDVEVNGRGRVSVAGAAERLGVRVHGPGNVLFRGVAHQADLTVHGSGHVNVSRVRDTLRRSCAGSGEVRVANPPHDELAHAALSS